jgi:hypothetical protein
MLVGLVGPNLRTIQRKSNLLPTNSHGAGSVPLPPSSLRSPRRPPLGAGRPPPPPAAAPPTRLKRGIQRGVLPRLHTASASAPILPGGKLNSWLANGREPVNRDSRADDSWIIFVLIGGAALVAFFVWQFSTTFGLDMSTGAAVFARLVGLAVLASVCFKFGEDVPLLSLSVVWPVLLGLLWASWWPALNFWSSQDFPSFYQSEDAIVWWNAWYTKWGVLALLIGGGFGVKKVVQDAR